MREKWKKIGKGFMAVTMVLSMMLGMVTTAWAGDYVANQTGSIQVSLTDLRTNRSGIGLNLYQVGTITQEHGYLEYVIDPGLSATGVDLNHLTTTEELSAASATLAAAVANTGITAMSVATDSTGNASFGNLTQGMYLLVQTSGQSSYGTISPALTSVPLMVEESSGLDWIYDVTVSPKATPYVPPATTTPTPSVTPSETPPPAVSGQITLTKNAYYIDENLEWQPLVRNGQTFYLALFYDEAGTIPVSSDNVRAITLSGTSTGSVTYSDLPLGNTYYMYETTADGTIIANGSLLQDEENRDYRSFFGGGLDTDTNAISLTTDNPTGSGVVSNVYLEFPNDPYLSCELTISKKVLKNGNSVKVADTFYAGVFRTESSGEETLVTVVELEQNDSVKVELPLGGDTGTEDITYTVKETDKEGTPVNKSTFAYQVSGEGDVTFTSEDLTKSITITNQANTSTPTVDPSAPPTTVPSTIPGTSVRNYAAGNTVTTSTASSTTATSVKTGDETPIALWLGLLAISASLILVGFVARRKRI